MPPLKDFEECLALHGLAFTRADFPGMNGLQVYRIERAPHTPQGANPVCRLEGTFADYPGMMDDMGFSKANPAEYDRALKGLRRAVDSEWPRTRWYYAFLALLLCDEGESSLAARAAQRSIHLDPEYAFGYFAAAVAAYENGDPEAGKGSFARAVAFDRTGYFKRFGPLLKALYHPRTDGSPDNPEAQTLIAQMDLNGIYVPFVFCIRAGMAPETIAAPA